MFDILLHKYDTKEIFVKRKKKLATQRYRAEGNKVMQGRKKGTDTYFAYWAPILHYTRFYTQATLFNLHIHPMEYLLFLSAPSTLLPFYK